MDLTSKERDRRWINLRTIMKRRDVDVVIAFSDFGDQASLQRYISNFRSSYDYVASLLYREEGCDIIMTHPGGIGIAKQISWTTDVFPMAIPNSMKGHNSGKGPSVGGQIANRLAEHNVQRVGVTGMEYFPVGWKETIEAVLPNVEFVDVWDDVHLLRLIKGDEEQDLVREACRISDEAWKQMPDIVKPGRKRYEVLGDIEHILRCHGCEDSFNMCMSLPMGKERFDRSPYSALPIEEDSVYLIEVSPRYLGYFGQQTGLVSTGPLPEAMRKAYDSVNRARDAALEMMRPGVDLIDVGNVVDAQLRNDGYQPQPSFGHLVGLELEDFHIGNGPLILQDGMTIIVHPLLADHPALMRADTYLISASGPERLTTGSMEPLEL
ncbi:MAG: M24 family metallopeptidase [Sphingorhabdus sp.]